MGGRWGAPGSRRIGKAGPDYSCRAPGAPAQRRPVLGLDV